MNRRIGVVLAGALLPLAGCSSADDTATAESSAGEPTVTRLTVSQAGAAGRCTAPSAAVLGHATTAFNGEVTSVEGGVATLDPDVWFAGDRTDVVEVDAPSQSLQDLIGAADFEEGEQFLVAADERGELLVCGYTAAYDGQLAALYAEAFGG